MEHAEVFTKYVVMMIWTKNGMKSSYFTDHPQFFTSLFFCLEYLLRQQLTSLVTSLNCYSEPV